MDTNLLKLNKDLIESKQSNVGEQIATQVGNVFSALKKFEDDTEALAIENADLLEADAIGVDLLPEAGKEFVYGEFTRIGEEMADAVNRKDKKRIRDLKLEGANLIAAQNTIGQMLKDHANDLFGTGGEGNYSKGSNKLMMNMLMNKEYSIRKDGKEMVIDFNGPNGKKGVKITDLDKHVYLKIDDLAINYDNEIKNIRQAAIKGLPFEKDAFAKVVNQTLNTVPKLVSSIWDDSFTLKDGKTMKELWEAEPKNAGKDANQYLRSGGDNWDENAVREFAKEKLMQGGTNDFTAYTPKKGKTEINKNNPYNLGKTIRLGPEESSGYQKSYTNSDVSSILTRIENGVGFNFDDDFYSYKNGGWYRNFTEGDTPGSSNYYGDPNELTKQVFRTNEPAFLNLTTTKTANIETGSEDSEVNEEFGEFYDNQTGLDVNMFGDKDSVFAQKVDQIIPKNLKDNPNGYSVESRGLLFSNMIGIYDNTKKAPVIARYPDGHAKAGKQMLFKTKGGLENNKESYKDFIEALKVLGLYESINNPDL